MRILASLLILMEVTSGLASSPEDRVAPSVHRPSWHRHQPRSSSQHQPRVLHDSLLRSPRSREAPRHSHAAKSVVDRRADVAKSPSRRSDEHDKTNGPEKLTAVAVAEYSGTRAVAYASYHGDQRGIVAAGDVFTTPTTPLYTRHHPGRRVCSRQPATVNHQTARQIRFVYTEVATSSFVCCPGWSQITRTSYGCNRPTCMAPCHNGGVCGPHGKCNCPRGFSGSQCQLDIDECVTEKPCGQICNNLLGSYECHCRSGFELQPDSQSCKRNDSDGTAFEARDLVGDYDRIDTTTTTTTTRRPITPSLHDAENEISSGNFNRDFEVVLKRLAKLEKQFARSKKIESEATELSTKVDQAAEGVAELRVAAKNVLHFLRETFGPVRQEVYDMKNKFEQDHRRIDHLFQRIAEFNHRLNFDQHRVGGFVNG